MFTSVFTFQLRHTAAQAWRQLQDDVAMSLLAISLFVPCQGLRTVHVRNGWWMEWTGPESRSSFYLGFWNDSEYPVFVIMPTLQPQCLDGQDSKIVR